MEPIFLSWHSGLEWSCAGRPIHVWTRCGFGKKVALDTNDWRPDNALRNGHVQPPPFFEWRSNCFCRRCQNLPPYPRRGTCIIESTLWPNASDFTTLGITSSSARLRSRGLLPPPVGNAPPMGFRSNVRIAILPLADGGYNKPLHLGQARCRGPPLSRPPISAPRFSCS